MRTKALCFTAAAFIGYFLVGSGVETPSAQAQGQKAKLSMLHMYSGPDGKTHFTTSEVKFPEAEGKLLPLKLKGKTGAEMSPFMASPADAKMVLKPMPARTWEIGVSGKADIEGAKGQKIYWDTGVIHLLEDTMGKGHGAIIRAPGVMLKIPVSDKTPRIVPATAKAAQQKDPIVYRLFYPGDQGTTFEDIPIPFKNGVYPVGDNGIMLVRSADKTPGEWHNQKTPEYLVMLRGTTKVESRSGEVVTFSPGTFALIEDATGSGHRILPFGKDEMLFLQIPIVE